MKGPRLLRKYLEETKQRPSDLSRAAGFDQAQISRWLHADRRPDIYNAQKLEKHTRGAVPVEAWAEKRKRKVA